jgi:hypothetical protein
MQALTETQRARLNATLRRLLEKRPAFTASETDDEE